MIRTDSPAWSYLPVDDLSLPVGGFTCLGSLERKHMTYELIGSGGGGGGDLSGFGALGAALKPQQGLFCGDTSTSTPAQKYKAREQMRAQLSYLGIRTYPGIAWQPEEQAAWNAFNVSRGLKPMLFGKYPMGTQCNALYSAPIKFRPAGSSSAVAGFGVDEHAEAKREFAAAALQSAKKKAALTSTMGPRTTSSAKGMATLFSAATATAPGPRFSVTPPRTSPARWKFLPPLTPPKNFLPLPQGKTSTLLAPLPVGPGMPDPAGCSPGYARTIRGTCELPDAGYSPALEEDNTKMYLIAGGLVVALGTAAFFMTRKGK